MKRKRRNRSIYGIIITVLFSAIFFGCGRPPAEDKSGETETAAAPVLSSETEQTLPIEPREKTYMGREIFVDEEAGYEYVIEELDPGNPPLVIMANKYLGDLDRWDIIADFNDIPDARKIPDYTPLKIPIRRIPRKARLTIIYNNVLAKRILDPDWHNAHLNMKLAVGDGVRTLENSKATISFDYASDLYIGENSMVFISDLSRPEANKPKKSRLNLEKGSLTITKSGTTGDEVIEVVTTETTVKPDIEPGGEIDFVTMTTDENSTLVMSYKGVLEVSAAGRTVNLDPGEGSEVKRGKPPSKPEPLIPQPEFRNKYDKTAYYYGNPTIEWEPVTRAVTYLVEIAYDPSFTRMYKIFSAVPEPKISDDFKKGTYYSRVCGIDAKGFKGYWSRTASFEILVEGRDLEPPVSSVQFIGGELTKTGSKKYLPPRVGIKITAEDNLSGVDAIFYSVDNGPYEIYDGRVLYFDKGPHKLRYYATDLSEKRESKRKLSFIVDASPPTTGLRTSL